MIYFKEYNSYNSIESIPVLSVEEFINNLQINPLYKSKYIDWWNLNRTDFKIYYFNFNNPKPILGVFIDEDGVALNKSMHVPPLMLLFIALHESKHADQFREKGTFPYFDAALQQDMEMFQQTYTELEHEANTYAIAAFNEMNIPLPMPEGHLRGNELAAEMVYNMMRKDIENLNATTMSELLLSQII